MKFEKREEVKYIGHLDTMRTFTRCIKRTNLPIKFSSGFNPRVQISFALPLAVGVTSESEYFDLELNGDIETETVMEELKKTLPEGFKILSCEKLEKRKSLMSLVKEAIYEVNFNIDIEDITSIVEKLENMFAQEKIEIEKKGKNQKEEIMDIKPMIIESKVEDVNYHVISVTVHCTAGSSNNLSPNYIVKAILDKINEENEIISLEDFDIHRKELILKEDK